MLPFIVQDELAKVELIKNKANNTITIRGLIVQTTKNKE